MIRIRVSLIFVAALAMLASLQTNLGLAQSPADLVNAAERGDVATVRALLEQGVTPNAAYSNGFNALSRAAYEGHVDVVHVLLEHGANPNFMDKEQQTPLFWAVFRAQYEPAKLLLDYGANANAVSDEGQTPFSSILRSAVLVPSGLEDQGSNKNRIRIAKLLIARGANVDVSDAGGNTALHSASSNWGSDELQNRIVKLIISAGANINAKNNGGHTPLMNAARAGQTNVLKLLLAANADLTLVNEEGETALFFAAGRYEVEPTQILIDAGAAVNVSRRDGRTALMESAVRWRTEVMSLLLKAGADVGAKEHSGSSAIIYAVKGLMSMLEMFRLREEQGEEIEYQYTEALPMISEHIGLLMKGGADPESTNYEGESALSMVEKHPDYLDSRSPRHPYLAQLMRSMKEAASLSSPGPKLQSPTNLQFMRRQIHSSAPLQTVGYCARPC